MSSTYVDHHVGDKVRLRTGGSKGLRGIILALPGDKLEVQLEDGQKAQVAPQDITNFSLAARKAWQTMKRQKGA
jgi:transcription elongation factor